MRATVGALLVLVEYLQAELAEREAEIAVLAASVSRGYARRGGKLPRAEPRDKAPGMPGD